ncbi:MAG: zinc ribbon domain-containing protein [Lachnospiraceae bacterium]|nr:zinc ribbon domain-containing protein [Lachnospiraceae bacterium]
MICQRCGSNMPDGQNFCTECGWSMQAGAKKGLKPAHIVLIVLGSILLLLAIIVAVLVGSYKAVKMASDEAVESFADKYEPDIDIDSDIDLDKLNEAVESMKDLDLTGEIGSGSNAGQENADASSKEEQSAGDVLKYTYADVVSSDNETTVTPNGGMNSSTVIANGKDLGGFLDYVDNVVLEKGRTINRELFCEILSTMLVDESALKDFDEVQKNMIMALALANNFHDTDVKINSCNFNDGNFTDYHYNVTAYGTDDIWLVNYRDRTVFFHDGKTEYVSTMFKDEYLAIWMMAVDEYYKK